MASIPASCRTQYGDRALVVDLERKTKSEDVERLRVADLATNRPSYASGWRIGRPTTTTSSPAYRCEPIPEISDRLEEGWEPLLAIASLAGEDVLAKARAAAIALASADDADEDHGQVLLVALRGIFGVDRTDGEPEEAVLTAGICKALNNDDELPFGGYRKGEGVNGRGLAKLLRPHGIRPKNVRVAGDQGKGYELSQFESVWERYAPSVRAQESAGEASQASQRPRGAKNGIGKPNEAGTEAGRNETADASEPSQNGAGTDGTQIGTESVPNPSHPQTAPTSQNGRVRDAGDGRDGTPYRPMCAGISRKSGAASNPRALPR